MAKKPERKTVTYTAREGGRKVVDPKGKPVTEETGDVVETPSDSGKD
jgi:hypothetical protein